MAIDSRRKRASLAGFGILGLISGPGVTVDDTKPQEWRQSVGYSYTGILAVPPVIPTPPRDAIATITAGSATGSATAGSAKTGIDLA